MQSVHIQVGQVWQEKFGQGRYWLIVALKRNAVGVHYARLVLVHPDQQEDPDTTTTPVVAVATLKYLYVTYTLVKEAQQQQ